MKLSFKNFQFDCEQQILTRDGKVFTLNEKPARVLTLFLLEPDKIHTKAEILDYVWPDRVITEQVVFQNISYLRVVFGSEAIKNFVKKGYQWQLPLDKVEDDLNTSPKLSEYKNGTSCTEVAKGTKSSWLYPKVILAVSLLLGVSLIIGLWFNWQKPLVLTKPTLVAMAFEHKEPHQTDSIKNSIANNQQVTVQFAPETEKNQALFDSPFRTWQSLAKSSDTWVLATRFYELNNGGVLRFYIQGEYRGWQGHIFAVDQSERIKQFNRLLDLLAGSEYFSVKSENSALAKLTLLHNSEAENSLLTHQLVKMNYELGYLDRAIALVDVQLESENNQFDLGLFNLIKAKVIASNTNWQSARTSVNTALKIFSELNLPHLESLTRIEEGWFESYSKNHPMRMKSINFAISKARTAKEPLQEVLAHLIQSALANKANQSVLASNELDLAKQLFEIHQLGDEHQIPVLYNLAGSADSQEARISHYATILERPFSPLYSDRFYYAAETVRNAHIENQQWETAKATIKAWQRRSFVSLTQAHIAFAKHDRATGIQAVVQAFRHAQIDYELQDALHAALLLLQHSAQGAEVVNPSDYVDYIKQNANHRWLRDNKPELEKLTLFKDVAGL